MLRWLIRRPARFRAPGREPFAAAVPQEGKAVHAGPLVALHAAGRPVWTARDPAGLARAGFMRNPIVYRSVRMIAEAASAVPWLLYEGARELDVHPMLTLLRRPNPRQARSQFMDALIGHLLVSGNAYVEAVLVEDEPRELFCLRPDRMRVVAGRDGWPEAYEYRANGRTFRYSLTEGAMAPILHLSLFHPLDDHYGLAPLEAALTSLDVHNAASAWNKALLDNAARPSGALVYQPGDGANLSEEQFRRLREELEANFSGAGNAGRPLLLDGGLHWQAMSLSPHDMDFIEAKNSAAREIALAFGVPPMLLGIPGDNTYSNYQEANRAFWRQTVLPLLNRVADTLGAWLAPVFSADLRLAFDTDAIEALSAEREALWRRVGGVDFLTADEKRAAVGYGPREDAPGKAG